MVSVSKSASVVLLSGGLDSAVALAMERQRGNTCHCLFVDYGQVAKARELDAAAKRASLTVVRIDYPVGGALLSGVIPQDRTFGEIFSGETAPTFLPGRNAILLSFANAMARDLGAPRIVIGANRDDASGYPDCRKEFFAAFQKLIAPVTIGVPLINKSKSDIVCMARDLGISVEDTWSCYAAGSLPCGRCDACIIRANAIHQADTRQQPERKGL